MNSSLTESIPQLFLMSTLPSIMLTYINELVSRLCYIKFCLCLCQCYILNYYSLSKIDKDIVYSFVNTFQVLFFIFTTLIFYEFKIEFCSWTKKEFFNMLRQNSIIFPVKIWHTDTHIYESVYVHTYIRFISRYFRVLLLLISKWRKGNLLFTDWY